MKQLLPIFIILFISCNNFQERKFSDKTVRNKAGSALPDNKIDYKQSIYGLYIGQRKDLLEKAIEINRNLEVDRSVSDTDSIQHYMNINEDLINIINPDTSGVLPALYFTFRKGILTDFICVIIYTPPKKNEQNIYNFLRAMEPYFSKLISDSNKSKLSQKLLLQFENSNREEKFHIDTTGGQYDMLFVYETKTK